MTMQAQVQERAIKMCIKEKRREVKARNRTGSSRYSVPYLIPLPNLDSSEAFRGDKRYVGLSRVEHSRVQLPHREM